MLKGKKKTKIILVLALVGMFALGGQMVHAQQGAPIYKDVIENELNNAKEVGLPGSEGYELTLLDRVAIMINRGLTVLGLLFLIITIVGGVKWMTAGGNENNIDTAKKILTAGIVGIIIVFLAYGISAFMFNVVLSDYWGR